MRKQFVKSASNLLDVNERAVLLLGDIGVFGFRDAFKAHPDRVYNVGILEQATVGMAAGLAMTGMLPIVHTIAPFLIERAYEQLKVDFGYQKLKGIFVSVGGSYDYASLGCTHHCPGDINLIENIDGFSIFVPGHPAELEQIFAASAGYGGSIYIRLSEHSNKEPHVYDNLRKPPVVQYSGADCPLVVAVGPCLDMVLEAAHDLPVNVLYTTAVKPFPSHELQLINQNVIVVEPYYSSQLGTRIANCSTTWSRPTNLRHFSLPRRFIEEYGDKKRIDINTGFYAHALRVELQQWIRSPNSLDKTLRG